MAVLFNALAPVVSHAVQRDDVAQVEVCTAMGVAMVSMPGQLDPAKLLKAMNHCAYCATHAASFAMPPTAGFRLALLDTHESHPVLFFQAPHPLPAWTTAQSRAPPLV